MEGAPREAGLISGGRRYEILRSSLLGINSRRRLWTLRYVLDVFVVIIFYPSPSVFSLGLLIVYRINSDYDIH